MKSEKKYSISSVIQENIAIGCRNFIVMLSDREGIHQIELSFNQNKEQELQKLIYKEFTLEEALELAKKYSRSKQKNGCEASGIVEDHEINSIDKEKTAMQILIDWIESEIECAFKWFFSLLRKNK